MARFSLVEYDSLLRFNNSGHFAFLVGTYITKCSPLLADFKCSGVEKFNSLVVQAANDCGFWVIFWMVLLAYGLGRYAEYGDPTTFDEYRKRVQCDLRRKSLFYCVPFQTVRQIQFWFKCDDFPLAVAKVSPPIAADTDYILFYLLISGSANSFGTSALLSPT